MGKQETPWGSKSQTNLTDRLVQHKTTSTNMGGCPSSSRHCWGFCKDPQLDKPCVRPDLGKSALHLCYNPVRIGRLGIAEIWRVAGNVATTSANGWYLSSTTQEAPDCIVYLNAPTIICTKPVGEVLLTIAVDTNNLGRVGVNIHRLFMSWILIIVYNSLDHDWCAFCSFQETYYWVAVTGSQPPLR